MTHDVSSIAHEAAALPEGWQQVRLGQIAREYISGGTPSTKNANYWDGNIAWTTSSPISEDDVLLNEAQRFVSRLGLEESSSQVVPKNSLLVGTRVGVGKAVINLIDIAISQDLTGVVLQEGAADPLFIVYQFKTGDVQQFIHDRKRGTTIKGISRFDLQSVIVNLPPLAEQRGIAATLRAAQAAAQARRRLAELERERKAALMQALFTKGTRGEATKVTEIGEVPESWEVTTLNKVAKIERGKFAHRPRNDPAFYGGTIPFIQTGDVTLSNGFVRSYSQTLNERGLSVSRIFPKGTIVITIAANIGYTGILEFNSAFPDSLIAITPYDGINTLFLRYYLYTQQPEMDRKAPQGTQKNINIEFLAPWPVPLPPLAEQREIAATLRACDAVIAGLEREAALHEELFRALLEELMTGRVRVAE